MNTDSYIRNVRIGNVLQFYNIRGLSWGETYESIVFPEGYEKPSKEAFEAKLKELIDAQPLVELRTKRNTVLDQSDKYATIDYPHATVAKQQEWLDYHLRIRFLCLQQ